MNKQILMIYFFLVIATLAAFWQVNNCDFIAFDDPNYITANKHVQNGITLEGIQWAFTTNQSSNWHPLTWISHMLDVQLFGMQPRWHHLTNLLFHIANTLLLFFVLHRMTKARWESAFVAALFALHPLHVESVAWVSERKDVLSTFFLILTMGAYCWYVDVEFANGALGHIDLTIPVRSDFEEGFQIQGEQGSVKGQVFLPWYHKTSVVECFSNRDQSFRRPLGEDAHTYKLQLENFADCILHAAPQQGAGVDDGTAAMRALVAIVRSGETGDRVGLADVTGAV